VAERHNSSTNESEALYEKNKLICQAAANTKLGQRTQAQTKADVQVTPARLIEQKTKATIAHFACLHAWMHAINGNRFVLALVRGRLGHTYARALLVMLVFVASPIAPVGK